MSTTQKDAIKARPHPMAREMRHSQIRIIGVQSTSPMLAANNHTRPSASNNKTSFNSCHLMTLSNMIIAPQVSLPHISPKKISNPSQPTPPIHSTQPSPPESFDFSNVYSYVPFSLDVFRLVRRGVVPLLLLLVGCCVMLGDEY